MTRWTQAKLDDYMLAFRRGSQPVLPPGGGTPADCEADEGPESRLQAKIVAFAREWGRPCLSFRQSRHAKGFLCPGWPDISLCLPGGRVVFLELKAAKGIVKAEQRAIHLQLMALGHEVYVVRSYRHFLKIVAGNP